jgi:hypothetical protein
VEVPVNFDLGPWGLPAAILLGALGICWLIWYLVGADVKADMSGINHRLDEIDRKYDQTKDDYKRRSGIAA